MRYSLIREMDISNGEGVGVSLFVQGCHFHCRGCFNQETWDFNGGKEWTYEIEEKFFKAIDKPYIKRVSILGGEPLSDENILTVYDIIRRIKWNNPDKKIWLFTGYSLLLTPPLEDYTSALRYLTMISVDVLLDGQFQLDKQDINHKTIRWVGSTNQRVIDIPKTIQNNNIILLGDVQC